MAPSGTFDFNADFALAPATPRRPLDPARTYDVLVLGAGPAGVCAALYLLRKGRALGVISKSLGGQVAWTAAIENYLGYRAIDGAGLVRRFEEQLEGLPADLGIGLDVQGVARRDGGFAVRAGDATYAARALVLATGKRPRMLGVPGESRLIGRGVAYCAVCDAPLFRGKVAGVVGGGNSGLEAAVDLLGVCPTVYLFQNEPRLTGDPVVARQVDGHPRARVLLDTEVVEVLGDERVRAVRVRPSAGGEVREVALEGLFVEIGLTPNSEPFRELLPLTAGGEVEVDAACRTAAPGVFAAGDVTSVPYKQIIIAAGEGAKAALSAHDYLLRLP
jgi:alkyl hydroperoxide reductase subunit F